jgi:phage terminase large subunit
VRIGLNGCATTGANGTTSVRRSANCPFKDWAEHIGSAWRYLGLCWKEITPPKEKKAAPKQLEYTVQPDGTVQGNMSVKEAGGPDGEASENDG